MRRTPATRWLLKYNNTNSNVKKRENKLPSIDQNDPIWGEKKKELQWTRYAEWTDSEMFEKRSQREQLSVLGRYLQKSTITRTTRKTVNPTIAGFTNKSPTKYELCKVDLLATVHLRHFPLCKSSVATHKHKNSGSWDSTGWSQLVCSKLFRC